MNTLQDGRGSPYPKGGYGLGEGKEGKLKCEVTLNKHQSSDDNSFSTSPDN